MSKSINMIGNIVVGKLMAQKELAHKRESEIFELFKFESPASNMTN